MPAWSIPPIWAAALDATAEELLAKAKITAPPVDALLISERLNITVTFDAAQTARDRHQRIGGRSTILLSPDDRHERLQWAAAHELGEVVAWKVFERSAGQQDGIEDGLRESVANLMASHLLLRPVGSSMMPAAFSTSQSRRSLASLTKGG